MTSTSPDLLRAERVLRGDATTGATSARFDDGFSVERRVGVPDRRTARAGAPDEARSIAEAVAEARARGRAEGFAAGLAEGRAAAAVEAARIRAALEIAHDDELERHAAAIRRAVAALATAGDRYAEAAAATMTRELGRMLSVAVDLAEAIVGHDVAARTSPGLDALTRALAAVPTTDPVIARLHPDEAAAVHAAHDGTSVPEVTVLADASIEPGGCIVEQGAVTVDALLSSAIRRVREALA